MIGPNVEIKKVKSLFDLFTGDGMIQGLFFDNGNITFVKKMIRTEKLLYEEKNGRIPTSIFHYIWFMLLHHVGMFRMYWSCKYRLFKYEQSYICFI